MDATDDRDALALALSELDAFAERVALAHAVVEAESVGDGDGVGEDEGVGELVRVSVAGGVSLADAPEDGVPVGVDGADGVTGADGVPVPDGETDGVLDCEAVPVPEGDCVRVAEFDGVVESDEPREGVLVKVEAADGVAEIELVLVPEGVGDGLGDGEPVGDELGDDPVDAVGVGVAVGDAAAGESLAVFVRERVSDRVPLGERVPESVCVGVRDVDAPDESDDVGDAVSDGVDEGVAEAVGVPDGVTLGEREAVSVRLGERDGDGVPLGERVPVSVGVGVRDVDAPDESDDVGVAVFDGVGGDDAEGVGSVDCERLTESDGVALPVAVPEGVAPPRVGDRLRVAPPTVREAEDVGDLLDVAVVDGLGEAAAAVTLAVRVPESVGLGVFDVDAPDERVAVGDAVLDGVRDGVPDRDCEREPEGDRVALPVDEPEGDAPPTVGVAVGDAPPTVPEADDVGDLLGVAVGDGLDDAAAAVTLAVRVPESVGLGVLDVDAPEERVAVGDAVFDGVRDGVPDLDCERVPEGERVALRVNDPDGDAPPTVGVAVGDTPPTVPEADDVDDLLGVAVGDGLGDAAAAVTLAVRVPESVGEGVFDVDAPKESDEVGDAVFDGVREGVTDLDCERVPEGDCVVLPVDEPDGDAPPSVGDAVGEAPPIVPDADDVGDLLGVPLNDPPATVPEADSVGDRLGVAVRDAETLAVRVPVPDTLGVRDVDAPDESDGVCEADCVADGEHVGGAARPGNGPQQPFAQSVGAAAPAGQ